MNELNAILLLGGVLSGVVLWLLFSGSKTADPPAVFPMHGDDALPSAKHYGYFPQIQRALSAADSKYLQEAVPPRVATKQALRERRAVARGFLKGLREDFSNLSRLGKMIAVLSPEVSREQETQRLILSLQFQMLYYLVSLRLSVGALPLDQLEDLTGLVGRLATRMDEAMSQITALSAGHIPGGLGV